MNYMNNYKIISPVTGLLLLLAWVISYSHTAVLGLYDGWQSEEYSHGYFIPILALWIGCHVLANRVTVIKPSWWGMPIIIAGATLVVVGQLAALEPVTHYGMWAVIVGCVFSCLGMQAGWLLLPALIYLLFAIPLPRLFFVGVSQQLQLASSALGVWIIQLWGFPVFREGNVIDLGESKLQVVEACSGLRYLFPLMSFGYLMAIVINDKMWKRVLLVLSTLPITLIINAFRIGLIGITVRYWGKSMAEGLTHDLEGWSLFMLCLLVLGAEAWLLMRIGTRGTFHQEYLEWPRKITASVQGAMKPYVAAALVQLAIGGVLITGAITEREELHPKHPPFIDFPGSAGGWVGTQTSMSKEMQEAVKASDYWLADYHRNGDDSPPINLFLAYYDSQRTSSSAHSPANCLPGSGWQIVNKHEYPIKRAGQPDLIISRMMVQFGDQRQLVYYWFDERGRELTEQYSAKWYLLVDSLLKHRTDGALVRLVTPLPASETEASADARMTDLLTQMLPHIKEFIPQ